MSPDKFVFILLTLLRIYEMVIFARILMSWVALDPDNPIVYWIIRLTDPVLAPAREIYFRLMEKIGLNLPLDFSPILIFLLIGFMERTLASLIF
ncbi:MAG: YggT family protein, partial [Fibrobacteres bacterium]|nr:YggT family protein [Fibrobacterota bacterium]